MKRIVLSGRGIITGAGALEYLRQISYRRVFLVTGGSSMVRHGWIGRAAAHLYAAGCGTCVHSGIGMNPTREEVVAGVEKMHAFQPDCVIALGGGSAMDAAKAMLLFYEFPWLNFENVLEKNSQGEIPAQRRTGLICIPSTSGTGSEVTRGTVITDTARRLKVPIMTNCLRPDVAILDPEITLSMPKSVAAETGMDALTHAMEAYINHNLDDFNEALCRAAIAGIIKWLPVSCAEGTLESREKVHQYQAMAGIGFANVGLGMVHGIAHSFGAVFNMAHGLTNAIILPYALRFNRQNAVVDQKLGELSYHCRCGDIVQAVEALQVQLQIARCFADAGISEQDFTENFDLLIEHAMLGATRVNPVEIDKTQMQALVRLVYYGQNNEEGKEYA